MNAAGRWQGVRLTNTIVSLRLISARPNNRRGRKLLTVPSASARRSTSTPRSARTADGPPRPRGPERRATVDEAAARRLKHAEEQRRFVRRNPKRASLIQMKYRREHAASVRRSHRAWENRNPEKCREWRRRWRERSRMATSAEHLLNKAVERGDVFRPTQCSCCGRTGNIQGHHVDYGKPLDVEWLCQPCHRKRHLAVSNSASSAC